MNKGADAGESKDEMRKFSLGVGMGSYTTSFVCSIR